MGFFLLLGLLSVGLLVGGLGGSDDETAGPDPEPTDGRVTEGTDGNDTLEGGSISDLILGQAGDDVISGAEGDDLLLGGGAQDVVRGDAGDDVLAGGGGNDALYGGRGDDIALGGAGNDTLYGNDGDDTLAGVSGSNVLYGNAGNDSLNGLDAPDGWALFDEENLGGLEAEFATLMEETFGVAPGAALLDRVVTQLNSSGAEAGAPNADSLEGGAGNDTLIGDKGDTLTGGAGRDVFIADYLTADQSGLVTITDYQPGDDPATAERVIITYSSSITPAPGPVSFVQTGTDVEVRLADGTVALLLTKVQAAKLSAAAFTLEPDTLTPAA